VSIAFKFMFTDFAETLAAPRWKPTAGTGQLQRALRFDEL
jgi:hypothetical protein